MQCGDLCRTDSGVKKDERMIFKLGKTHIFPLRKRVCLVADTYERRFDELHISDTAPFGELFLYSEDNIGIAFLYLLGDLRCGNRADDGMKCGFFGREPI